MVKEQYLLYKKASDQYLAEVTAGLNWGHHLFAVSPPYFDLSTSDAGKREAIEHKINTLITNFVVRGEEVDPYTFHFLLPFFLNLLLCLVLCISKTGCKLSHALLKSQLISNSLPLQSIIGTKLTTHLVYTTTCLPLVGNSKNVRRLQEDVG